MAPSIGALSSCPSLQLILRVAGGRADFHQVFSTKGNPLFGSIHLLMARKNATFPPGASRNVLLSVVVTKTGSASIGDVGQFTVPF